ncbi:MULTISPECIES: glycosyltransferase [Nostocales]|uniref:Glycosyltransferase family 2 protein n=1 Tax=Dolichospermum flos-aquae UHCC 0037 TaxID=2590026 RepID=A0ACC7SA22_DOLFA|nr:MULTISPECIES: glycosyltransferase family 2 protein [Nostocales]MBO1065494.1 glycosyltransferase family 2 protein [Anabaena sp. 54]MTJ45041.1 glycosyltransferase family 2 protein [Dolichospermum flos-aquae UHCC 0037]
MIYFLIVNYYSTNLITKLIGSLPSSPDSNYQVIIINNSLDDNSINDIQYQSTIIIDSEKNLGFGGGCNLGLQWIFNQDKQGIVWIINPDAYLPENTLEKAQLFFNSYQQLSILGTIVYNPEQKIWFAGGRFIPENGAILEVDLLTNNDTDYINCDWVSGCSIIINLNKFSECPLFDHAYFLYYEDFDFCRRYANQGHLIAITKQLSVIHQPSSITNRNIFKKIRYSTYSYLFTINRYTNKSIFTMKLILQIIKATMGLIIKPQAALGKIYGICDYMRNQQHH